MQQRSVHGEELRGIVAIERRVDVRVIANVAGRYTLSSKRDGQGERRIFACKALNMSTTGMVLTAPVLGPVGDRVIATIDHFGRYKGAILRVFDRGFAMSIAGSDEDRTKLAAKLIWFERHRNDDIVDSRKHGRTIPQNPCSTLIFADGHALTCFVIDMSASGAAVSADIVPLIGMVVAVGSVVGRVVRRFPEGFAVRFVEPESPHTLEERLIRIWAAPARRRGVRANVVTRAGHGNWQAGR